MGFVSYSKRPNDSLLCMKTHNYICDGIQSGPFKTKDVLFLSCSGSHFETCDGVIRVLTHVVECLYLILRLQIGFNRVNTGLVPDTLMGPSL